MAGYLYKKFIVCNSGQFYSSKVKNCSGFGSFKEKILKKEGRGFTYKEPKEVSKKSLLLN
jgi:hypothetical protein